MQDAILAPVPPAARYLTFAVRDGVDMVTARTVLAAMPAHETLVVGLGQSLIRGLGARVHGLDDFPVRISRRRPIPSTPAALWVQVRGADRGEVVLRSREVRAVLADAFSLMHATDAFRHGIGRDLTGYVDGTENPVGDKAVTTAIVSGAPGIEGSSFVAVQRWIHDLDAFERLSPHQRDLAIGRRLADDEEIDEAPLSAHVKRTAQEDFEPEAFMVRRSMPWTDGKHEGLYFVCFCAQLRSFEVQLSRMLGEDDGVVDAIFGFSQPDTGAYFWCPPVLDGQLDLRAL